MKGPDIRRAEANVEKSKAEFAESVDHLEDAIHMKTERMQGRMNRVKRPFYKTQDFISRTRTRATPYVNKAKYASGRAMNFTRDRSVFIANQVKQNPTPYIAGAIVSLAGVAAAFYFLRKRRAAAEVELIGEYPTIDRAVEVEIKRVA